MKKTQFIDILSTIKRTIVIFLSIILFIQLAVNLYTGLTWSAIGLKESIDSNSERGKLHDINIILPSGITTDNLDAIRNIEGVDEIEGSFFTYAMVKDDAEKHQIQISRINSDIDVTLVKEGVLPKKRGEVAILKNTASLLGIEVGDTIALMNNNDELAIPHLAVDTFKVTAIVSNPDCMYTEMSNLLYSYYGSGLIFGYMYVTEDSFDLPDSMDYNEVLIRSDSLREYGTASDEYSTKLKEFKKHIQNNLNGILKARTDSLSGQRDAAIAAINSALEEKRNEINEAETRLYENEEKIEAAKQALDNGWETYHASELALKDKTSELNRAKAAFLEEKKKVGSIKQIYEELKVEVVAWYDSLSDEDKERCKEIKDAFTVLVDDVVDWYTSLTEAEKADYYEKINNLIKDNDYDISPQIRQRLETFITKIHEAEQAFSKYLKAESEIKNAEIELDKAYSQLNALKDKLNQSEKDISSAEIEIENGRKELDAGKAAFEEGSRTAEEQINNLNNLSFSQNICLTRSENIGVQGAVIMSQILKNVRYSLVGLFVIVGLFICFSSITRMVHNQSVLIGVLKAYGYKKEITYKYLVYVGLALVLGCIIGCIGGATFIQSLLYSTFEESFDFIKIPHIVRSGEILIICGFEIVIMLLTTWVASRNILKRNVVKLLGDEQKSFNKVRFYEKFGIWKRVSLINKTIVNNFFTDKRRVFGTLVGIAGCTALIVSAFTLNNNILKSLDIQFDKYFNFDTIVYYYDEENGNNIRNILDNENVDYACAKHETCVFELPDDSLMSGDVLVPYNTDEFDNLSNIEPCRGYQHLDTGAGVWMNASYLNYFGENNSKAVTVRNGTGVENTIDVNGYYKFYLPRELMIMNRDTYASAFGEEPKMNAYLVDTTNIDKDALYDKLTNVDDTISVMDYYKNSKASFETFQSVADAMVVIYVFLSIIMGLMVTLNTLSTFIDEKKREIIILMINGYSKKVARSYILRDTLVITILGIIGGIIVGCAIGNLAIRSFNTSATFYKMGIDGMACLYGIIGTVLITAMVAVIALRKVAHFRMSDINK